ncbi:endonuclease/exonuclease/phosphatase family protein [Rhizosphaericola mali]|uniref:Endonuclease/exonuclease/phosphatase n=1 Tax=Rhizosphaericola mali TaxID=2545455 RepID=A0A5P2G5Q3_9BACT|nr:endonuclease/exonuclease/phosphatase [Rhizosphaericola mali]QES89499.1 endonuclease/exonuclease/phosphatase [Rhizosphaericola mali]
MRKILLFLLVLIFGRCYSQRTKLLPLIVAFYNSENFYDTINNTMIRDEDFLEDGAHLYNGKVYKEKLDHIAQVLHDIGIDQQKAGFSFIGLAEIENDTVLNDLVQHPLLKERKLQFVHFDSKDARGVDVALIFNPLFFKVEKAYPIYVPHPNGSKQAHFTRDILYVKGKLCNETIHIYVNHWPSRYGGQQKSIAARNSAAIVLKKNINTILNYNSMAKIIVMGDLNDDPKDESIYNTLRAVELTKLSDSNYLYNPWIEKLKKGRGTLAYQNTWSLFDQIIVTKNWISPNQKLYYKSASIFRPNYLVEQSGNLKGYPLRTFSGNNFQYGYSDHFPVFVTLLYALEK